MLEHHSAFDDGKLQGEATKDKLRLASENWDAPIVVTTAVQFFEPFFAGIFPRCRKLHNMQAPSLFSTKRKCCRSILRCPSCKPSKN